MKWKRSESEKNGKKDEVEGSNNVRGEKRRKKKEEVDKKIYR